MTDISTDAATDVPDVPMRRDPVSRFDPPPDSLASWRSSPGTTAAWDSAWPTF